MFIWDIKLLWANGKIGGVKNVRFLDKELSAFSVDESGELFRVKM